MPIAEDNWSDLMKKVKKLALKVKNEDRASYNFRNVYFLDEMLEAHTKSGSLPFGLKDIPEYMHMARHVYRSANYTKPGQYVKCFHNPEKALILHNHFPLGMYEVSTDMRTQIRTLLVDAIGVRIGARMSVY